MPISENQLWNQEVRKVKCKVWTYTLSFRKDNIWECTVCKWFNKNPLVLIVITIFLAILTNIFVWKFVLWTLKPELEAYTKIYILNLCYYWFLVFISFFSKILVWWKKYFVNYYLMFLVILLTILSYTIWKLDIYNYIYCFIFVWFIWMIWTWIMF